MKFSTLSLAVAAVASISTLASAAQVGPNLPGGDNFTNPAGTPTNLLAPLGTSGWYYNSVRQTATIGVNGTFPRSGDGSLLAISGRYTKGAPGPSKLWLVRSDGTGMRQLTTSPGSDEMPTISPDGKRVAFVRTAHDGTPMGREPELYTVPTGGGEAVRLTENTVEDVNPVFSPDGRSIAFGEMAAHDRGSVQIIRSDGSGQCTVTSTGLEYPDPDYSPNGRSLVFVGQVPGAHPYENALYTVRASGTGGCSRVHSRASSHPVSAST